MPAWSPASPTSSRFLFSISSHMSASLMPGLMKDWAHDRTCRWHSLAMRIFLYRSSDGASSARSSAEVMRCLLKSPPCSISWPSGPRPVGNRLATGLLGGQVWPYLLHIQSHVYPSLRPRKRGARFPSARSMPESSGTGGSVTFFFFFLLFFFFFFFSLSILLIGRRSFVLPLMFCIAARVLVTACPAAGRRLAAGHEQVEWLDRLARVEGRSQAAAAALRTMIHEQLPNAARIGQGRRLGFKAEREAESAFEHLGELASGLLSALTKVLEEHGEVRGATMEHWDHCLCNPERHAKELESIHGILPGCTRGGRERCGCLHQHTRDGLYAVPQTSTGATSAMAVRVPVSLEAAVVP
mmetsp:Transcript_17023/g.48612  ORF Transcript_17023/g.48612 Transcript_17023/m.48612 type:complete len:355 (+) Transcript_17023:187-1251(+)